MAGCAAVVGTSPPRWWVLYAAGAGLPAGGGAGARGLFGHTDYRDLVRRLRWRVQMGIARAKNLLLALMKGLSRQRVMPYR